MAKTLRTSGDYTIKAGDGYNSGSGTNTITIDSLNVTIPGNLTVGGGTSTVSTTNTTIEDNIIELNTGATANTNSSGIIIERGSAGNNAAIIWKEDTDSFVLGTTTATAADKSSAISITGAALEVAGLTATTGSFSSTLAVTGATTLSGGATVLGGVTAGSVTTNEIVSNGSNADLTLDTAGTGDINLTAGADINVPANIGITFGDDGEKIEGDGTDLTISSSNNLTIDAAGDVIIDADNADIKLQDGGTEFGRISRVTSDLVIKSMGNNNDILLKGLDDSSTITALSLDMSAAGAATFNSSVTATQFDLGHVQIDDGTVTHASSSGVQELDRFTAATYRGAKYIISVSDSTNSRFETIELLITHDGSTPYLQSAGVSSTGSSMVTFTTDISSGDVRILMVPVSSDSTTYKFVKTLIEV